MIDQTEKIKARNKNKTNDLKSYRRRREIARALLWDVEQGRVDDAKKREARKRSLAHLTSSAASSQGEPPKKRRRKAKAKAIR